VKPLSYSSAPTARPLPKDPLTLDIVLKRSRIAFQRMEPMLRLYQAIAEMFYPERADFLAKSTPGDERYWDIFDEEAMILRRNLANQIGAMIRPRGQDWFKCKAYPRLLNKIDSVRIWCEEVTKTTREILYTSTSNFSKAMTESDNDYVAFGISIVTHTYNSDKSGLIFECLHPRDCAWYKNSDFLVDEFYQRMTLSLQDIDAMGLVLTADMIKIWKDDPHREIDVQRCVYPVERYTGQGKLPRSAKYVSMYFVPSMSCELKTKSGVVPFFRTWPYWIREWMNVSGEPSGRSPCTSVALATARGLNQAGLSIIESLEKIVNPPLVAPDDGIAGEIQIRADGITYYDSTLDYSGRDPIYALPTGNPIIGMQYAENKQAFLARAFLQNIINFPGISKEMTKYEAQRLWEQYMRDAAPVFEPLEADNGRLLEPVFERAYDSAGPGKSGAYAPPPEELIDAEVKFDFDTPLSAAYARLEFEKAGEAHQYIMERSQTNPGVVDLIDQDAMDHAALTAILPQTWVRPMAEVNKAREVKDQQKMQEMIANMALQAGAGEIGADPKGAPQVNADPMAALQR